MFRETCGVRSVVAASLVLFMACAAQAQQPGKPVLVGYPSDHHHHHHHHVLRQPSVRFLPVQPSASLGFFGYADPNWGLVIQSVVSGSRAQQLGLETNDIIVEINGLAIRSDSDYFAAMQNGGGFGRMVVLDWRSQQYLSVSLAPSGPYVSGGSSLYYAPSSQVIPYSQVYRQPVGRPLASNARRSQW